MADEKIKVHREFLKDNLRLQINFLLTDQNQGAEPPPLQKPTQAGQQEIPLPEAEQWTEFSGTDLLEAINRRRSHRNFKAEPLTLAELGMLLWATQGLKGGIGPGSSLRSVPSAGCRHPFETYLLVSDVETLQPGLYRYLSIEHALVLEKKINTKLLKESLTEGTLGQSFLRSGAGLFCLDRSPLPQRMALSHRCTSGHPDGCWTPLPESLPGQSGNQCRHLCHRRLSSGVDGSAAGSGWR